MNKEDIKTKILKEGKDSDWGLYGPCSLGGSSCHNSLQLLVKTLCWLHTGLDKGFFCKLQDQATGVLFNQHRWPRDETSAATHPSPGTDGWICTTDTSCTEKYALGMKYLEKATPCSKALKPHQGKKKRKRETKKKRGKKRQFCHYAESASGACANPAPPFKSDP